MEFNLNSIAALLFCCDLRAFKQAPLSLGEWLQVEKVIRSQGLKGPASLFAYNYNELVEVLDINEEIAYKMTERLKHFPIFFNLLNQLESQGLSIITKYDELYPKVLKRKLKRMTPIYFYYCGSMENITKGVTIAGLQSLTKEDNQTVNKLVDKAIEDGYCLVSNDNKGVDKAALTYMLHHGGRVVMFTCSNIKEKQNTYRRYLRNGQLLLLSFVDPNRYFNVPNGLQNNKYACIFADYHLIVSSKINYGATWFTIIQNIHHHYSKIIVRDNDYSGNKRLLDMDRVKIDEKDLTSLISYDDIYDKRYREEILRPLEVDQMTIFEFIGENNE